MSGIYLAGTQRVVNRTGLNLFDKKGRPLWKMPKPYRFVQHAVDAVAGAVRRATGQYPEKGSHAVPVYRGEDRTVAKKRIYSDRRAAAGRWIN